MFTEINKLLTVSLPETTLGVLLFLKSCEFGFLFLSFNLLSHLFLFFIKDHIVFLFTSKMIRFFFWSINYLFLCIPFLIWALCFFRIWRSCPAFPSASSSDWGTPKKSWMTFALSSCQAEVAALRLVSPCILFEHAVHKLTSVLRLRWWSFSGVGLSRSGWWEGLGHWYVFLLLI